MASATRIRSADPPAGWGRWPALPQARISPPQVSALRRERLERTLDSLSTHRSALVVAPAGSGKTTLLAQFAAAEPAPVAWYRAEATDGTGPAVLRALERAFALALGAFPVGASCADELASFLDSARGDSVVLVVDDLHTLRGTPAEPVLERLVECAPDRLRVIFASRCVPGFNLSRLRVSGWLLEVTADDLRFRSWEVEELFRDFYGEPLPPEDLAELARRTEGWVAGLQLFHLATRGKTVGERRQVVAELGSRSRMVREYLARNVLDELPADLPRFLLETSVSWAGSPAACATSCSRRRVGRRPWRSSNGARSSPWWSTRSGSTATTRFSGRTSRASWWSRSVRSRPGAATGGQERCWSGPAPRPTPSGPTAGPRTGTRSRHCSVNRAATWSTTRAPGSTPFRRVCSTRTRGFCSPGLAAMWRWDGSIPRGTPTSEPKWRSDRPRRRRSAAGSASTSACGWMRRRRCGWPGSA